MASAYRCQLSPNQLLYLSNQGDSTTVTLSSGGAGQQQQSSNGFSTGEWTSAPQLYRLGQAAVIVIEAARQTYYVQCQNGQVQMSGPTEAIATAIAQTQPVSMESVSAESVSNATASPMPNLSMPSMAPMPSMSPMMPPMQMNNNPMSMQLGNMSMSMSEPSQTEQTNATSQEPDQKANRFCTQCGAPAAPTDKFCGACGNALI